MNRFLLLLTWVLVSGMCGLPFHGSGNQLSGSRFASAQESFAGPAINGVPDRFQIGGLEATNSSVAAAPVHPWKDDATLHDVDFVGRSVGWAVGDRGTIWKTADGGETWSLLDVPTEASLRSLCFMMQRVGEGVAGTSQIAWVAGRATHPATQHGIGVILKTTDGGKSWLIQGEGQNLPPLHFIRFFGMQQGVAVGEATPEFPTGVLISEDGGETWQSAPGYQSAGWYAGAFSEFHDGVVVGPGGRVSLVAGTTIGPPRSDATSLRAVRNVAIADGLNGWAVGDGGLVLQTSNGGVSWEPPTAGLPPELSRFADFHAVAAVDERVWLTGSPGGCIWHSIGGGAWEQQMTGQTAPIQSLHFATADNGWAVGVFGTILRTTDGGRTWNECRAGSRRSAVLALHTRPERISFNMLAKYAADQGYRTAALAVPRFDPQSGTELARERQFDDAVVATGGISGRTGWRLPVTIPEIDSDTEALTEAWQQHTEGRLGEVLLSHLVAEIRTWRPSILVVDEPDEHDAVAAVLLNAVRRAVDDAGDSTRFLEHQRYGGVAAWKVDRVMLRAHDRTRAGVVIDPYEVLPRAGTTVDAIATLGRTRLLRGSALAPQSEAFLPHSGKDDQFSLASSRDFWTQTSITPGSDARRTLFPVKEAELAAQQEMATRQRNFRGIAERFVDDPLKGAQIIGEIRGVVRDMPRAQAALQIAHLANDYRRRRRWDLAEAAFIELINQYPDQPVAAESMLWLLHLWSSDEMAWQRSRGIDLTAREVETSRQMISQQMTRLLEATSRRQDDPVRVARELSIDPLAALDVRGPLPSQNSDDWKNATAGYWRQQAVEMARIIRRTVPAAYESPEVLWPVASALRRTRNASLADAVYRQHSSLDRLDPLGRVAGGELWLAHPADQVPAYLHGCQVATLRPHLDGVLGDDCWRDAQEMVLIDADIAAEQAGSNRRARINEFGEPVDAANAPADPVDELVRRGEKYPFVQFCRDDQFLYIAASLPRAEGTPTDGPAYEGRQHDDDLTGFDRLTICLDIDRDYTTAYRIDVDQRGHVAESCWEDTGWNPRQFIAVDADATHWRLEMAIPFEELAPGAPVRHSAWAVAVVRTTPKVKRESWVPPAADRISSGSYGLLQFR